MRFPFRSFFLFLLVCSFCVSFTVFAQSVNIINYATDINGQVRLEVNSSTDKYYIVRIKHHVDSVFKHSTSMTLGQAGTTIITEPLEAYPANHYEVLEYDINLPFDTDGDGIDDITEYNNRPFQSPLNAASSVTLENGLVNLSSVSAFNDVSVQQDVVPWIPYLNGKEYVKFIILEFQSGAPEIYFINSVTHELHIHFATFLGVDHLAPTVKKGQIIYHPSVLAANGTLGTYVFNYSNNEYEDFETIQRTHELLSSNMPFLSNNLGYYITDNNELDYQNDIALFQDSRVPVLFETDVYAGIDYWGLHQAEGFGFFRLMNLNEIPGAKDIVLYESIPNSLPRVGGIITSVIQTPLSHVNLRAIHDDVPNAFIRDPLNNDTITSLLNHYIYLKVDQSGYEIREASLQEVNDWFDKHRPEGEQIPPLNLDYKKVQPLDQITFEMYDGFGAKVTNVATMRKFDFAEETIPDGFGIPFYYYQEFMKYNGFFDEIGWLIQDPYFIEDRDTRDIKLAEFREKIEGGRIPAWMLSDFGEMQRSFPAGASIRCRSSTNNEDLPGFSGAGLYESKTQHPDEGHIVKSIKQVYASLWNLRAFEEREFYRISHFNTSMGVLCHENFSDEKVNGVGVSGDPVYNTAGTFYLNSQAEGELITNPSNNSAPEELLLKRNPGTGDSYSVIQYSSLINGDTLLMTEAQLSQLRLYLATIHDNFAVLYHAEDNPTFAMDIEYKIDKNDQLIIKQARPWVSFVSEPYTHLMDDQCEFNVFPNPAKNYVNVTCEDCADVTVRITDLQGKLILEKRVNASGSNNTRLDINHLKSGVYFVNGYFGNTICGTVKFVK